MEGEEGEDKGTTETDKRGREEEKRTKGQGRRIKEGGTRRRGQSDNGERQERERQERSIMFDVGEANEWSWSNAERDGLWCEPFERKPLLHRTLRT